MHIDTDVYVARELSLHSFLPRMGEISSFMFLSLNYHLLLYLTLEGSTLP